MKVKDVLNIKALTITSKLVETNPDYSHPEPESIIIKGACLLSELNYLLISWDLTDSCKSSVSGGKTFKDRLIAKRLEHLLNENIDRLMSDVLEMEMPES